MRTCATTFVECDVPAGAETVAAGEVRERLPRVSRIGVDDGKLCYELPRDDVPNVATLRTVAGAWIVERYEGRRPSVVVSDRRMLDDVGLVASMHPILDAFTVSGAGTDSHAMRRVRDAIARTTGLRERSGGLLIRVRRTHTGWDALVALGPRALADRPWRVASVPGALNAPLAAVMVRLVEPRTTDRFLNVACGSGTIAIERRLYGPAAHVAGIDVSPEAVEAARANAVSSGCRVALFVADAAALPLRRASFDAVCADLPWGDAVGSHVENVSSYEDVLRELGRVTRRRARACILTAEARLMQRVLGSLASLWRLDRLLRVEQGGARPGLFVLRRA